MGDSNVHNRVEAGGVQGANFVSSQVNNPTINIHTPGREKFSLNYMRIKVIGRGTFGDAWLVKPKHVTTSEEFLMKEIRCCDQDVDARNNEIEILRQLSHENVVQYIEHFVEEEKFLIKSHTNYGDSTSDRPFYRCLKLQRREVGEFKYFCIAVHTIA